MPNQREEAADDSPADLPCLEKLDSPTGMKFYHCSYCFQARSGTISNWIITTMAVLIICGCVCPVCGVREPTHRLIIQPDGAGKLCFQPEPRAWDSGEPRLLLQTQEPSYRQARKTLRHHWWSDLGYSHSPRLIESLVSSEVFINCFPFCSLEGRVTEIVHRAFWDSLQEQLNRDPPDYSHAVVLLQEVKTVSVYGIGSRGRGSTETSDPFNSYALKLTSMDTWPAKRGKPDVRLHQSYLLFTGQ